MSSTVEATALRKTALNPVHRKMGAKMVDFGGWDMPVEYPAPAGVLNATGRIPSAFGRRANALGGGASPRTASTDSMKPLVAAIRAGSTG